MNVSESLMARDRIREARRPVHITHHYTMPFSESSMVAGARCGTARILRQLSPARQCQHTFVVRVYVEQLRRLRRLRRLRSLMTVKRLEPFLMSLLHARFSERYALFICPGQ
jgi:hypothetical protein